MSIRFRILLGISTLILLALLQGSYMLWQVFRLGTVTQEVAMNAKIASSARETWDYFRSTRDYLNKTLEFTEFEEANTVHTQFQEKYQQIDKTLTHLQQTLAVGSTDERQVILNEVKVHLKAWGVLASQHLSLKEEQSLPTYDALDKEALLLENTLNQLVSLSLKYSAKSTTHSEAQITQGLVLTIVGLLFGGLVVVFLSYIMFQKIAKPIGMLHQLITKITTTGEFHHKVHYESKDELGLLVRHINSLTTLLDQTFNEINRIMSLVARGNFTQQVIVETRGDLLKLKDNINFSISKVDLTMRELTTVMHALKQGNFKKRVSHEIEGEFKKEVDEAMSAMESVIEDVNQTMLDVSQGLFSKRVQVNVVGDLDHLKQRINTTIDVFTNTIHDLNQMLSAMAQGNLTQQLESTHYQNAYRILVENINHAAYSLKGLIQKTIESANVISHASSDIASGNANLAQRTAKQAAFIEQTSSSLDAFMLTIHDNALQVKSANEYIIKSTTIAEKGGQVVHEVMDTMRDISVSSNQISDIIGMIDTIAFQTNILALNAAVESARAGEAGRGFAVVASEVRMLAQRSAEAAREITQLITKTVGKIQNGSQLVETAGGTMEEIVSTVKSITDLMSQITTASVEQTGLIQNVKTSVDEIEEITQQNAALVEEVASTSDALAEQSHDLEKAVRVFKI